MLSLRVSGVWGGACERARRCRGRSCTSGKAAHRGAACPLSTAARQAAEQASTRAVTRGTGAPIATPCFGVWQARVWSSGSQSSLLLPGSTGRKGGTCFQAQQREREAPRWRALAGFLTVVHRRGTARLVANGRRERRRGADGPARAVGKQAHRRMPFADHAGWPGDTQQGGERRAFGSLHACTGPRRRRRPQAPVSAPCARAKARLAQSPGGAAEPGPPRPPVRVCGAGQAPPPLASHPPQCHAPRRSGAPDQKRGARGGAEGSPRRRMSPGRLCGAGVPRGGAPGTTYYALLEIIIRAKTHALSTWNHSAPHRRERKRRQPLEEASRAPLSRRGEQNGRRDGDGGGGRTLAAAGAPAPECAQVAWR